MAVREQVAKWAPGPKSTGAIAEITGWDWEYVSNTQWGIDGETALRAWNKGKCSVEQGSAAAKACRDGEALAKIIKDRRVAVRVAVLSNPACPWGILVSKAAYRGRGHESFTVQRAARETLPKSVKSVSFEQAWGRLADGQDRVAYVSVAEHPGLKDEHIDMILESNFVMEGGRSVDAADLIAEYGRLAALSTESLVKIMRASDESLVHVCRFIAKYAKDRDAAVLDALAVLRERGKTSAGWPLSNTRGVSSATHRVIRDWMRDEARRPMDSTHMSNPESPWQLWIEADITKNGAGDALGRAVADVWGDDADVWRLVFELLQDFKGSIREMLLWLSIYHPNEKLDREIESAC
jgi:hypothetical protein